MSTGPKRLIIVRHAESLRNAVRLGRYFQNEEAKSMIGDLANHDVPITDIGEAQAAATGVALRERFGAPDTVFHSGYLRTKQTADGLLAAYPQEERRAIDLREHLFIRERDSGYTYDMTEDEAIGTFPFLPRHWSTFGMFFATPVGGESLANVTERTYHFLRELEQEHDGETVLVVTHGYTVRALRYWLEHLSHSDVTKEAMPDPRNCGVTVYERGEDGHLHLVEYNTVLHAYPTAEGRLMAAR